MIRTERVTSALIAMLRGALTVPVGDHGTDDISTTGAYATVHRIEGGGHQGSLGDPHQDVTLVYQVESAGRSRNVAEATADAVRTVMVGMSATGGHTHVLAGDGWKGGLRVQQTEGSPRPEGIDEQGTVGVWAMRERFEVTVHPT